jgi:predicted nucleic acid-binding Zn ribbon protein
MAQGGTPPDGFEAMRRADYASDTADDTQTEPEHVDGTGDGESGQSPARVCPKCSALERTNGAFCPHCGQSYERRRRRVSRRTKIILAVFIGLLLVGAGVTAVVLKRNHDNRVAQQRRDAKRVADAANAAEARKRQQAADDAAAKARADKVERDLRHSLIRSVEHSVTKDAQKDVSNGLLTGPILSTTCTPIGGGSVDDLTAQTGKFECIAVNKISADGTESGYRFSATVNYDDGTYQWHIGSG